MSRLLSNLTLQVEPTTACNLDCAICMRRNLQRAVTSLSVDSFKRILDSGSFRHVGLHGWGEPLLNRGLFEMVAYAESRGVLTNLTTNGTLVRGNVDRIFDSGLREIAFGVYDRELFLRSASYVEGLIRERKRRGLTKPRVYLDITVYEGNSGEVLDLVSLAEELQADAAILHRLFNAHSVDPSMKYIARDEEEELFAGVRQLAKALKLKVYLPPRHSYPCRVVRSCVFVTVEGKVTPCCFLPDLCLGDALEDGVEKVMRSKAYYSFVKDMKKHPICSRCEW
ncbi:MAG: radical SAM protein [Chloroflexota bacterium]|nr:radical SAM protein [Chloroflexota bacterium]